ncbi:MAG: DUF3500 domain-containing protein [Bryobacterales bacterium]|nr:DUF3500 domain-containing protein [Bryobacterales bacterium]
MRFRIASLAAFAALLATAYQQNGGNLMERFRVMSRQSEERGLAAPFRGVTAKGEVENGLYTVRSTGVSTEPVRRAVEAFLASLDGGQRARTQFKVDDPEWRKWMNQHFYVRQGVSFLEMSEAQRESAIALLRASLSAKGLKLTRDIMRLNHTLGELNNNDWEQYGEWRYHLTVMGSPSATEPWGWQLDGHHAIINYFVLGTQVVMSPVFVGSEPAVAESGRFKGTAILQREQDDGLKMLLSLDPGQRKKAIIEVSKTGNDNLGEAFKDNLVLDYAGISAREMTAAQQKQLLALAGLYIGNMDDGHARVKMSEVRKHLDRTYFAWIGGADEASVYYYRIHSPVVLIEFDHQKPANLRHLARDPNLPNRQHIHCVVRTPNGNDYGKDLLRQHYLTHPHTD